jgi:hypothetical protein
MPLISVKITITLKNSRSVVKWYKASKILRPTDLGNDEQHKIPASRNKIAACEITIWYEER